ncbi:MAG: C40 family peptidase [Dysgonomonas sp.]
MSVQRKSLKVSSLLLIISLAFISIGAGAQSQPKKGKKKSKAATATLASKKIELVKSDNNIEVMTNDGNIVALPKVDKKLVDQEPGYLMQRSLLADADISRSFDALQKQLIERKEMQELSSVLGVTISDASLLDFYREAADWLGTRYRRGGMSRKAVDCSGFTNIIYKNVFGKQLDRVSTAIAKNVKESVAKDDLLPGDMVFFSTFGKKYINHVGVYIGEGKFIHASIKHGVIVSSLAEGYYSKTWRKGGRI